MGTSHHLAIACVEPTKNVISSLLLLSWAVWAYLSWGTCPYCHPIPACIWAEFCNRLSQFVLLDMYVHVCVCARYACVCFLLVSLVLSEPQVYHMHVKT
jgi:hypothetical protein